MRDFPVLGGGPEKRLADLISVPPYCRCYTRFPMKHQKKEHFNRSYAESDMLLFPFMLIITKTIQVQPELPL